MILVLSTYRTGSTNFCKQLAEQNNYENLDECFHENLKDTHKLALQHIEKNPNTVVKLFPYHIQNSQIKTLLQDCVKFSEKIYLLVRKDFDNQVKSYYIARQKNDWHSDFEITEDVTLIKEDWSWCTNFLHNQYLDLDMIRSSLPDYETIYTHQLDQSKKYVRPVKWDRQPGFTNIDIEELFY